MGLTLLCSKIAKIIKNLLIAAYLILDFTAITDRMSKRNLRSYGRMLAKK